MDELFLFLLPGAAPDRDRLVRQHSWGTSTFVWVPDAEAAAEVAAKGVADGVRLIELYRGFDLPAAARIIDAVGGGAPVGVAVVPESSEVPARTAAVYDYPDASPGGDRIVREHSDGRQTILVMAPDKASMIDAARSLAADGVGLIEFCGGTPLTTAAAAVEALRNTPQKDTRISLVQWPFESIDGVYDYKASFADLSGE